MEKTIDKIIEPIISRDRSIWLLKQLLEEKDNIREAVIKLLAFHSKTYDKRTGEIEKIGLNLYELSSITTSGTEKTIPKYQRLEKKPSYNSINTKVIPEMVVGSLIIQIDNVYTAHNKKKVPIFYLTLNGLSFALLFTNENFDHTEEIIKNCKEFMKFYNIPQDDFRPGFLLEQFSKLEPEEQKHYLKNYYSILASKEMPEKFNVDLSLYPKLLLSAKFIFFYQFFLLPVFLSTDKEILEILRKCWSGGQEIFRNNLQNLITDHLKAFDLFQEKLGLPGQSSSIVGESRWTGTVSLLFWIDKEDNRFMREEVFKKRLNMSTEKIKRIYDRSTHWAVQRFIQLTKSNKKEDKALLEEIISFGDEKNNVS